jgi:hypothetical protein
MKIGVFLKSLGLISLLLLSSVLLGLACRRLTQQYRSILSLDRGAISLLLWTLGAMLFSAFSAGLVAALVRPFGLLAVAFSLSTAAVVLAWGVNWMAVGGGLIYFVLALLYGRSVMQALAERRVFSVGALNSAEAPLFLALTLLVAGAIARGYAANLAATGEILPLEYRVILTRMVAQPAINQIESQPTLQPEEREQAMARIDEMLAQTWSKIEDSVRPYVQFAPYAVWIIVLLLLRTIIGFVSWIPAVALRGAFPLLKAMHLARTITETAEVSRLSLA